VATPSSAPVAVTTAAPTTPGRASDGLIAYSLNGQLFLVAPDGTGSRPITPADWHAYDPRWSPDGQRIAFLSLTCAVGRPCDQKGDPTAINVIEPEGSGRRTLVEGLVEVGRFGWSPDGRWLAYNALSTQGGNLVAADGSERRVVGSGPIMAWLPDGRTLAYEGEDGWHTVAEDGTGDRPLVDPLGRVAQRAQWSPDGSQIVFGIRHGSILDRSVELWITDARGGSARRMTEVPDGSSFVGWNPDGRIAYLTPRPEGAAKRFDLVLANPDGSAPKTVAAVDQGPNGWSPDGTRVYLFEGDYPATRLVIIEVTGATPRVEIPAEFDISWQARP
jgi:Tol biopolymer transport system component